MECPKGYVQKEGVCVSEKVKNFPATGKFMVVDTMPVPHPYCITSKHVVYAADHCSGMLTGQAIKSAEQLVHASCGICKGKLKYEDHKSALLVAVDDDRDLKLVMKEGLQKYLLDIKAQTEKENYAGFAFIKKSDFHPRN